MKPIKSDGYYLVHQQTQTLDRRRTWTKDAGVEQDGVVSPFYPSKFKHFSVF